MSRANAGGGRADGRRADAQARANASTVRRRARQLVSECRRREARMRELLRADDRVVDLDARERAQLTRLTLGVVATRGALDQMIDGHLRRGLHLEPKVRDALQVAVFELCWLSTANEVVVSQGVELVRECSPRAAGLANALLRRVATEDAPRVRAAVAQLREYVAQTTLDSGAALAGPSREDIAQLAAVAAGLPLWLCREIVGSRGGAALAQLALAQLEPPPVWVAANRRRFDEATFRAHAEVQQLELEPALLPGVWRVVHASALAPSGLVQAADAFPADLAAQMVARIAAPLPGERMLEVGQGRATKSALLLMVADELSDGQAVACRREQMTEQVEEGLGAGELGLLDSFAVELVCLDNDEGKVRLAQQRLASAGFSEAESFAFDGRLLAEPAVPAWLRQPFDQVFIDAPCSGSGTMRRHPEIAWSLERASLETHKEASLPALQLKILRAAASRVRPGGVLTYATCSVLAVENEELVAAFLRSPEGEGFVVESVGEAPAVKALGVETRSQIEACVSDEGFFRSTPQVGSFDGHFCARLRRRP